VIADRTACDVRYSYWTLSGIAVVIKKAFTYLQFRTEVCFWCAPAFFAICG